MKKFYLIGVEIIAAITLAACVRSKSNKRREKDQSGSSTRIIEGYFGNCKKRS